MTTAQVDHSVPTGGGEKVRQWPHLIPVIGLFVIAVLVGVGGIFEGGSHAIDDVVICVLALVGIAWSVPGTNRRSRSLVPLGLVSSALVMKLLALAIERGDSGDLGDDAFALLLIAVLLVISGLVYLLTRPPSPAR
jgi:hypothetical protein